MASKDALRRAVMSRLVASESFGAGFEDSPSHQERLAADSNAASAGVRRDLFPAAPAGDSQGSEDLAPPAPSTALELPKASNTSAASEPLAAPKEPSEEELKIMAALAEPEPRDKTEKQLAAPKEPSKEELDIMAALAESPLMDEDAAVLKTPPASRTVDSPGEVFLESEEEEPKKKPASGIPKMKRPAAASSKPKSGKAEPAAASVAATAEAEAEKSDAAPKTKKQKRDKGPEGDEVAAKAKATASKPDVAQKKKTQKTKEDEVAENPADKAKARFKNAEYSYKDKTGNWEARCSKIIVNFLVGIRYLVYSLHASIVPFTCFPKLFPNRFLSFGARAAIWRERSGDWFCAAQPVRCTNL